VKGRDDGHRGRTGKWDQKDRIKKWQSRYR
jgi:hypothetical protein